MVVIACWVRISSKGPAIFWSDRVGLNGCIYRMPKFRTMLVDTPNIATHLLKDFSKFITPIGSFLRKTSLDELPQLYSILVGDMSFVGPRPALYNQYDLIEMRRSKGIDQLVPGLTGWAQINGRDEVDLKEKVELDFFYLRNNSITLDIKILVRTITQVIKRKHIAH